jgi:hypothetical protein
VSREGGVLVVRHGAGRARKVRTLDQAIAELWAVRPDLPAALRFHATGDPTPPSLDGVQAVIFWLADPLRDLHPECHAEATAIAERARDRGIRLVNPPEALSRTGKCEQARIWREAGVPTPLTLPFGSRSELEARLAELGGSAVMKADRLHGQVRMRVLRSADEARALADDEIPLPGALSELVDARASFRSARAGGVYARFHHKKRALVLGERVCPRSVLFADQPIVALAGCTFEAPAGWRRRLHPLRPAVRSCVRADRDWWRAGPEQGEVLRRAARALGLDVCALDYASFADGRIVLWEANPFFHLVVRERYLLAGPRRFEARRRAFLSDFAGFLDDLLAGTSSAGSPPV